MERVNTFKNVKIRELEQAIENMQQLMDERNELRVENEELKEKLGKSIVSDEARD